MTNDPIPVQIYGILACPDCKGDISYNKDKSALKCEKCNEKFEIKDGIPILMPKN